MIMKDTEKKSNLEPWFCECSVFVLTFVFAWGFFCFAVLFLCHTGQGVGKAGQAGAQAPLQETGHHLRAEDWGPRSAVNICSTMHASQG